MEEIEQMYIEYEIRKQEKKLTIKKING